MPKIKLSITGKAAKGILDEVTLLFIYLGCNSRFIVHTVQNIPHSYNKLHCSSFKKELKKVFTGHIEIPLKVET